MAEEYRFADLEEGQKRLHQLLHAEVLKREVSQFKLQVQIKDMEANVQKQIGAVNGKLDNLTNMLASIQQQLGKIGRGKAIIEEDGSPRVPAQEWVNEGQTTPGKDLNLREPIQEWVNEGSHIKSQLQIGEQECEETLKPLSPEESLGKVAPISPSIFSNNDFMLGISNLEAPERKDRIGVPFLVKISKDENNCKIHHSPLQVFASEVELEFYVVSYVVGMGGIEIDLGKIVNPNCSHTVKLGLSENFAKNEVFVEKLVKEKIHICSMVIYHVDYAKSTTTEHLIDKLGNTDKRFIERFKKEAVEMNKRSFKFVRVFDELKTVNRRNKIMEVSHEWNLVIKQKSIWMRKLEEIIKEEYVAFCDSFAIHWEKCLAVKHILVEGLLEFRAILFVPTRAHFDLFDIGNKSNKVELYFLRVLIMGSYEELVPEYLSFVTSIRDSEDLPLNISRGGLQPDETLKVIRNLVKKFIELFSEIAQNKESYNKYYEAFSNDFMFGRGADEDFYNYEKIVKLLSFYLSKSGDKMTTLNDYEEKRLLFATKEGLNLDEIEDKKKKETEQKEEFEVLCKVIKHVAGDNLKKVLVSYCVVDSLCCLVISEYGWTAKIEKIMMARALRYSSFARHMLSKNTMVMKYVNKWKNIIDDFVVTVVRAWVEFRLLTNWFIWLEILVADICYCCIKKSLVAKEYKEFVSYLEIAYGWITYEPPKLALDGGADAIAGTFGKVIVDIKDRSSQPGEDQYFIFNKVDESLVVEITKPQSSSSKKLARICSVWLVIKEREWKQLLTRYPYQNCL